MGKDQTLLLGGAFVGALVGYFLGRLHERVAWAVAEVRSLHRKIKGMWTRVIASTWTLVKVYVAVAAGLGVVVFVMVKAVR